MIFVDTSFFVALLSKGDHGRAVDVYKTFAGQRLVELETSAIDPACPWPIPSEP